MINLKDIALDTKKIEVDFPGLPGFVVTMNYISKNKSRELLKGAEKTVMRSGRAATEIDDDKFTELFVGAAIASWKGLTLAHLDNIMLIDISEMDPETEVPFSLDNGAMLMKNSQAFDEWINGIVFQIDSFRSTKQG